MLDAVKRTTIHELRRSGHGARTIARMLGISRGAVRRILESGETVPQMKRQEILDPKKERVIELLAQCQGSRLRAWEELNLELIESEEEAVSYSTFTAYCRRHQLVGKRKKRAGRYEFDPGEEMQHDTSPHNVVVGGKKQKFACASLVLCHSRMIYARVYRRFRRFECKLFLTEALEVFGGAAGVCMIDNSNVVIARGSGANAVPAPEMELLGKRFGFTFVAHAIGHANRSARVERPFHFIENNFYVGRKFQDLADLNIQLKNWCREKNTTARRHLNGRRPVELLEEERPYLSALPGPLPDISQTHLRVVDLQGQVTIDRNHYSAPEELISQRVQIRETRDRVQIFSRMKMVADHPRLEGNSGLRSVLPEHEWKKRFHWNKAGSNAFPELPEEKTLKAASTVFGELVDHFRKKRGGRSIPFIRRLHRLFLDYPTEILVVAVRRALDHGLDDLERIERMVLRELGGEFFRVPFGQDWEDDDGEAL